MSRPLAQYNPEPIWSPDNERLYRYKLCRMKIPLKAAQKHGTVNFIMLNPSTATRECNDPTVRNCELLARCWGYENLVVTNLFAYRAANPCKLMKVEDPVGAKNDQYLLEAACEADLRIAAWGTRLCLWQDRAIWLRVQLYVEQLELKCLRLNDDHHPTHPGRIRIADFPLGGLQDYCLAPTVAATLAPLRRQRAEA